MLADASHLTISNFVLRAIVVCRLNYGMVSLPFMITGAPRSGTGYMAKLMQALGYDVGHEAIGKHGISSWLWAADSPVVPCGTPRNHTKADFTIQVVRHPWMVVSSLVSTSLPSPIIEEYFSKFSHFPYGSTLRQAVHVVVNWNKLIRSHGPDLVVKVEEAHIIIPKWLKEHGFTIPDEWVGPPTNYNSRDYSIEIPITTLSEIHHWEQDLLFTHANHYGYEMLQT